MYLKYILLFILILIGILLNNRNKEHFLLIAGTITLAGMESKKAEIKDKIKKLKKKRKKYEKKMKKAKETGDDDGVDKFTKKWNNVNSKIVKLRKEYDKLALRKKKRRSKGKTSKEIGSSKRGRINCDEDIKSNKEDQGHHSFQQVDIVNGEENKIIEEGYCYQPRYAYIDNSPKSFLSGSNALGLLPAAASDIKSLSPDILLGIGMGFSAGDLSLQKCPK